MKTIPLLLALFAAALALPASVHAAKDPAKKEARQAAKATLEKYDKDSDGKILGDEATALQKDFDADKNGPLKRYDTNADGKIDTTEISAIHAGKGGKGGKKKKNAV